MTIGVAVAGIQTSIQDAGRLGFLNSGLSIAGPMDMLSMRIANLLVGNELPSPMYTNGPRGDAALECTLLGPALTFHDAALVALAGAEVAASLDGAPCPHYESFHVLAGQTLKIGPIRNGARTYLAIAGGIQVDPTLGSRSQNLFNRVGPLNGRALRAGDQLPIRLLSSLPGRSVGRKFRRNLIARLEGPATLRVVLGPQADLYTRDSLSAFLSDPWTLSLAANRMGLRFKGPRLNFEPRPSYLARDAGTDPLNIVDDMIPVGGIQTPSGMEAILMGVENPTVGGFSKIATVISSDMGIVGQMRPNDVARFKAVTTKEAHKIAEHAFDLATGKNIL